MSSKDSLTIREEGRFRRAFKKYSKNITHKERKHLYYKFRCFKQNPFAVELKTHKLKGAMKGYYSFSLSYDARVIFRFLNSKEVLFVDIGNHSVYD